ncbi:disks large-associated protein 4 isoform X2 [Pangasianodon hypophthalmus]|uniref:disks large-associated protein 4 isoform X2 n=1 Tax=Pangasianodon hypophthalmus TaxID=310915 RepID=UPI000EFE13CF|nr:disks large-associated protein 4 isoform X2 [Pangasianodon hypophthalmus]
MKGYTPHRTRYLSDCDPPHSPSRLDPLYPPSASSTLSHQPYIVPSSTMDHYGALEPHHFSNSPSSGGLPPDCLMPLNNQLSTSSTFPRIHYNSHFEQGDFSPPGGDNIGGISTGTLGTSMSIGMGMNMGLGAGRTAMITSGSATISGAGKMNRLPANLLDQFEKQLPGQRDGFSTLQFHRSTAVETTKQQQRTDSPGKIRYLVHSVQKLFAKSQSLESSAMKGNMNGRSGSSANEDKHHRRSKSKDRAKSEGTAKRRPRSNMSGYWSSDDLDSDIINYRNPVAMMTLGRQSSASGSVLESQVNSKYSMQGYNTISEHTLKTSKSNNDLKHQGLLALPGPGGGGGGGGRMAVVEGSYGKGGPWSTLTLGPSRQLCQKGSATLDRSLLKSKSCQQELACHYLQMPSTGEWSGTLGRGEIPCRRMRSGSYVKAMGDLEDSDDSDSSLKPSPKTAARRQSYLRATQQSLSDQFPSRNRPLDYSMLQGDLEALWSPLHSIATLQQIGRSVSCLPSLREFSGNRSVDNLDCIGGSVSSSFPRWDDDDFSQGCSTLGRNSCISQLRDSELNQRYGEDSCSESVFGEMHTLARSHSRAEEPDLPTCFRSRSHSYLRAIQAGCSQDDDTASLDSDSPPPTATTVRTYSTSTVSTCITTCKKIAPPPVPPRNSNSKPFISVTVQSSTESAQDGYLDNHDRKSQTNGSSSDSSLTKGSRNHPPVLGPREPQVPAAVVLPPEPSRELQNEQVKAGGAADEPRTEPVPRRKLSSIGIQVDSIQEIQNRVETPPPLARFQSIGVQVEDGWTLSRSSSMASKQETDSDTQDLSLNSTTSVTSNNTSRPTEKKVMVNSASQSVDFHAQISLDNGSHDDDIVTTSGPSRQLLTNRSTTRSSSSSFSESLDPALDPSSLPPPDPWLESGNGTGNGGPTHTSSGGMSACRRDGHWFLKLLQAETARMEGWCKQMEEETKEHQLSEEVLGKVRSAVGSAQLLMSQKFQQFRGLCEQNLNVNANPRPTAQDLAGFWDLLQLSIEDISLKFDELYHLKANEWKLDRDSPDKQKTQKQAPPVPKKPGKSKAVLNREKSSETADKQRQEARKRLMAAKRAQSVKQNSATESSDNIEIYVPEAQTRL